MLIPNSTGPARVVDKSLSRGKDANSQHDRQRAPEGEKLIKRERC